MMLYHVRNVGEPAAKISQGRALLKSLADTSDKNSVYGVVLRDQLQRIESISDEVFIHDDLDEASTPFFLLHQVVEAAGRHMACNILSPTATFRFSDCTAGRHEIRSLLSAIPEEESAVRDQYADFIDGLRVPDS